MRAVLDVVVKSSPERFIQTGDQWGKDITQPEEAWDPIKSTINFFVAKRGLKMQCQ